MSATSKPLLRLSQDAPRDRSRMIGVVMYAVLLSSYVLNATDRQLFPVLAVEVRQALDLSLQEVGFASTVFTLGMGVAGLPTAYLMSKLSRKNVSLVGLAVFSVATLMTARAADLSDLLLWRFLSGAGEAMQFTAILAIGTTYFYRHRGMATGAVNFCFGIGAILGPNLGVLLLKSYGWAAPFAIYALFAIPIALLIVICVKGWFSESRAPGAAANLARAAAAGHRAWTPSTVILSVSTMLAGLVLYGYVGLYPTFLREAVGFSPTQAAFATSFYGLGAFASLLGGWLGDRFDHRKLLLIAFLVASVSGSLLFTSLDHSLTLHALLSFIFGASISGLVFVNLAAGLIRSVHPDRASLGAGILVASCYIPASFAGYLLATLRNAVGWETGAILQLGVLGILAGLLALMSHRAPFAEPA